MLAECALLAGAAVGDWGPVCGSTLDASQKAAGTATQVIEDGALNTILQALPALRRLLLAA